MRILRISTAILMAALLLAGCQTHLLSPDRADENPADIAAPAGRGGDAPIEQVILHLYTLGPSYTEMSIHRILDEWSEDEVTYDSFANAYDPLPAGSFVSDAWGWQAIDITDLVQGWVSGDAPNHGLLIRHAEVDMPRATYASKDRADLHPYIEVHYAEALGFDMVQLEILEDAFVWQAYPASNFGDLGLLYSGRKPNWEFTKETLLRFETPEGPEEPLLCALGDRVWFDEDGDGLQYFPPSLAHTVKRGVMEPGIAGVAVKLLDCDDNVLAATVTDDAGEYWFTDLPAGDYRIKVSPGSGYNFSPQDVGDDALDSDVDPLTGLSHCVTLVDGEINGSVDCGLTMEVQEEPAALGDYVWYDTNLDGIQDPGESGFAGVPVILLDCAGNALAEMVTGDDGAYLFDGLAPGDYMIEVVPDHYTMVTAMDQGGDDTLDSDIDPRTFRSPCVSLASGEFNDTVDAGLIGIDYPEDGAIGDRVWLDANMNGIQDDGGMGVSYVWVTLYDCNMTEIASVMTDYDGAYLFDPVPAGDYRIGVQLDEYFQLSPPNQGDDEALDSDVDPETGLTDCFALAAGEWNMDVDIGIVTELRGGAKQSDVEQN